MSGRVTVVKVAVSKAVYSIDKPYDYVVPKEYEGVVTLGGRVIVPFGRGNRKSSGIVLSMHEEVLEHELKALSYAFSDGIALTSRELELAYWLRRRCFCTLFEAANALLPPGIWSDLEEKYAWGELPVEDAYALFRSSRIKCSIIRAVYESKRAQSAAEIALKCETGDIRPHLKQLIAKQVLTVTEDFKRTVADKKVVMVSLAMPAEEARNRVGSGKIAHRRTAVIDCLAHAGMLPEKELCYLTGVTQALIKKLGESGILTLEKVEVYRRPSMKKGDSPPDIILNDEQTQAYSGIKELLDSGKAQAALLFGVTGSGKTEVFIELIKAVRKGGKTAILLVPEIALTPQMLRRFYLHFGDDVAVIHSSLTYTQRFDEYKRIRAKKAGVVLGTRSAIFAPLEDLGIVIIDEEQEHTYKSESAPRFHARDVAKFICSQNGALLLLASATPTIESYYYAKSGRYRLFTIHKRYNDTPLPKTIVSDMGRLIRAGRDDIIGEELDAELTHNLSQGEQSILFLNRRGSAKMAICPECGYVPQCERCSVSLVYHARNGRLMCHHCDFSMESLSVCPECGGGNIRLVGAGTQRIEDEILKRYPGAKVLRMDADTTTGRTSHEKILDEFIKKKADILIGTQMVAKGLDFDNVTLIGVLDADLPSGFDCYSQERTFSLLTQVVGRAGRRGKQGRAVLQTLTPQNPVLMAAARQDFEGFYTYEIGVREATMSPPFYDLFSFILTGNNENEVLRAALYLSGALSKIMDGVPEVKTDILGPAQAMIYKVNNRFRYTVSFRGQDNSKTREVMSIALSVFCRSPYYKRVSIAADLNPYSF